MFGLELLSKMVYALTVPLNDVSNISFSRALGGAVVSAMFSWFAAS